MQVIVLLKVRFIVAKLAKEVHEVHHHQEDQIHSLITATSQVGPIAKLEVVVG